ncbi:phosphoribosylglycinamide formyltransferase [Janibacter sp. DB-40]|uniref:phosphoribosylglycinamide formyltransferase n=1 Tax=Janibacter sp. DB-40 TaxID=3028808 RepID=UPI002405AD06|nr:phosphoribosylglycinamide formyltransferase [Janibacter sp. DB-40]
MSGPLRLLVLVSGSGSLLQALLDAQAAGVLPAQVVAVGADRESCTGLERAERAGVPTFVEAVSAHPDRAAWDVALAKQVREYAPDLVVTAGFMKILGPTTLGCATFINTHPALLPSFPGAHGVRDALAHGVRVTGSTAHLVDAGVDTGPIIEQRVVEITDDDTEETLHERIKAVERIMLVDVVTRMATGGWRVEGRRCLVG